ncbi:hypothetical protein QBC47DRAFT_391226 [Echria macrotheca]|uniref:Uncharacterized protein n=1 Tax=Echria macrotheca TaxID=438768 RepID=A0AAJ0B575_9PEZI|nr:hypothetical protein QBC47DRAFT_391226 [Echria macrotheca]
MTVTPSANPTTVTSLVPLISGDSAAAIAGSTDTASTAASTTPPPNPLALSTAVSTTTMDTSAGLVPGSSLLGESPTGIPTGAAAAPVATETPQGMDPVAERAMISVGSIAAFVMVASMAWLIFRRVKRRRNGTSSGGNTFDYLRRVLPARLANLLPSSRTDGGFYDDRGWEKLGEASSIQERPPTYSSGGKTNGAKSVPLGGFYGHEKAYPYQDTESKKKEDKPRLPRLQTQDIPAEPKSSMRTSSSARPLSSHPVNAVRVSRGSTSANTTTPSTAVLFSHHTQDSFSSTNAAQFGTITAVSSATTMRSKMGLGYYNQSEMARTPSMAYDPQRRQVNRASELSSISSGFGDGDIIVTNAPVPVPQIPPNVHSNAPTNGHARFSWMSQEPSKRDTVYTQSSEDMPPRFRSVNSWVDQQTGRIKRAQQREHGEEAGAPPVPQMPGQVGIPGIHNPPGEQRYEMMMDDEQPRPVELPAAATRR